MKKLILCTLLFTAMFANAQTKNANQSPKPIGVSGIYIPTSQYPTFDATGNHLLSGALWVGFDATAGVWKYNKQVNGRGLTDPGNPTTWKINGTTIGKFNGDFSKLPSGTHINFKYDPTTQVARYNQDDIAVRVGGLWVDKYEGRIIDVADGSWKDNDNDNAIAPADNDIRGNGQAIAPTWMLFSQQNRGTTGVSWFVANVVAGNTDKRLLTNAEWQMAAAGTQRSDSKGMTENGETWQNTQDQDVSRYGVVGCVGSLWEWVADQGQYGPTTENSDGTGSNTPAGQQYINQMGVDGTWHVTGWAYTRNVTDGAKPCTAIGTWVKGLHTALRRGGDWKTGVGAGVFALTACDAPSLWMSISGLRAARR